MNFLDAFSYPIRRSGWIMILIGAIFSVILDLLQHAPKAGFGVGVFSAGYFGAFYLDIVNPKRNLNLFNNIADQGAFFKIGIALRCSLWS